MVAKVLLRLARESNAPNFEFSQLLWRCKCASPRRFCRTTLCGVLSTRWHTTKSCTIPGRTIVAFLSICFAWWYILCLSEGPCLAPRLLFFLITYPGIEVTSRLFWSNSVGLRVDFIFPAEDYSYFPVGIAVRTLVFGRIFAKFEDLGVLHVGDQFPRFFAELVDLLRLVQVLSE